MAEAFGLAASAAGIVSLGLQVYEGLASYVEGVKEWKPELAAISKQANNLQAIIKTLQVAIPRIDAILTTNESPLLSTLKTVEEELWALKLFLGSLQDVSGQSSKIVSVLKEQKKKLVYPFHRPTLEKLQKRLESANSALQISLQVVNFSQSSLMGLQSGVGSLESSMASMATALYPTQASLESMEGKLDLLLTEGRTENEQLETSFQAVHANVGHVSHKVQQTMSMVQIDSPTEKSDGKVLVAIRCQGNVHERGDAGDEFKDDVSIATVK
ncbi:hypothetical protein G7054_g6002 [Neopestalotiopsis clavispora]|nr:hypothetical protein G7054_g6002 [Neopestalotiopsis clavispora]